jgi:hypothetical protein
MAASFLPLSVHIVLLFFGFLLLTLSPTLPQQIFILRAFLTPLIYVVVVCAEGIIQRDDKIPLIQVHNTDDFVAAVLIHGLVPTPADLRLDGDVVGACVD